MANILSNEKYALYFQKVNLLYKRPEVRASLEVILSVFTVTILVFAAIRPTLTNITTLQKKITYQEVVNKKADNKITQLLGAQKQLETYTQNLYLFEEAVPDDFSYADGARRVELIAKKNGMIIDSLGFEGVVLKEGKKTSGAWKDKINLAKNNLLIDKVNFTMSGKPSNTMNFLKEIENMDRLAVLNNISLSKQVGTEKTGDTLKVSGDMTFYFYSDKQ